MFGAGVFMAVEVFDVDIFDVVATGVTRVDVGGVYGSRTME